MSQTPGDADGAALGLQVGEGGDRQVNMVGRTLGAHVVDWHDEAGEGEKDFYIILRYLKKRF
jgi:hypothetical protein